MKICANFSSFEHWYSLLCALLISTLLAQLAEKLDAYFLSSSVGARAKEFDPSQNTQTLAINFERNEKYEADYYSSRFPEWIALSEFSDILCFLGGASILVASPWNFLSFDTELTLKSLLFKVILICYNFQLVDI